MLQNQLLFRILPSRANWENWMPGPRSRKLVLRPNRHFREISRNWKSPFKPFVARPESRSIWGPASNRAFSFLYLDFFSLFGKSRKYRSFEVCDLSASHKWLVQFMFLFLERGQFRVGRLASPSLEEVEHVNSTSIRSTSAPHTCS